MLWWLVGHPYIWLKGKPYIFLTDPKKWPLGLFTLWDFPKNWLFTGYVCPSRLYTGICTTPKKKNIALEKVLCSPKLLAFMAYFLQLSKKRTLNNNKIMLCAYSSWSSILLRGGKRWRQKIAHTKNKVNNNGKFFFIS